MSVKKGGIFIGAVKQKDLIWLAAGSRVYGGLLSKPGLMTVGCLPGLWTNPVPHDLKVKRADLPDDI